MLIGMIQKALFIPFCSILVGAPIPSLYQQTDMKYVISHSFSVTDFREKLFCTETSVANSF